MLEDPLTGSEEDVDHVLGEREEIGRP